MFVGTLSLSLLYLFDNESCGNAKYRLLWRVPFSNYRWYEYTKVQGRLGSDKAESRSWSENIIFIYDDAPAHHSLADPGQNTELNKLPSYSPFLNIVEKSISELKAAIKADISCPEVQQQMNNREEARRKGIALRHHRTQLLLQALQRNVGTITPAECGQWFRFMQKYLPRCLNREQNER